MLTYIPLNISHYIKRLLKSNLNRLLVLLLFVILAGCNENPGVVGNSFIEESANVYSDTLVVDDVRSTSTIPDFTGDLNHYSAGIYTDPLFGEIEAIGMIRPSISRGYNIDTLGEGADAKLQMVVNQNKIYGDTTSTTRFQLRRIRNIWRPGSWERDSLPDVETNVVAEFEVTRQDTLELDLPQSWLEEYKSYFNSTNASRDSTYKYNNNGLAVVSTDDSKIVPFNRSGTRLMLKNEADTTYQRLPLEASAFGFKRRQNSPSPFDSTNTPLVGFYDNAMVLNPEINDSTLGSRNMSRVEIAMFENNELLQDNLPQNHVRPNLPEMRIFRRRPDQVVYGINPRGRYYRVAKDSTDNSYRVNITSFVNQILFEGDPEIQYYVIPESENGIIYSTVLYNGKSDEYNPKILITAAKTESVN